MATRMFRVPTFWNRTRTFWTGRARSTSPAARWTSEELRTAHDFLCSLVRDCPTVLDRLPTSNTDEHSSV